MKKNLMRWLIALAVILPCLLISASAEDAVYGTQSYVQSGLTNSTYGRGAQTRGIVAKGEYVYGPLYSCPPRFLCDLMEVEGISTFAKTEEKRSTAKAVERFVL